MQGFDLFREGINLMFVGMGFVFIFLILLIYAVSWSSRIINKLFPEPEIIKPAAIPQPIPPADDDVARLRPVIVATIAHHRRQQGLH